MHAFALLTTALLAVTAQSSAPAKRNTFNDCFLALENDPAISALPHCGAVLGEDLTDPFPAVECGLDALQAGLQIPTACEGIIAPQQKKRNTFNDCFLAIEHDPAFQAVPACLIQLGGEISDPFPAVECLLDGLQAGLQIPTACEGIIA